MKRPLPDIGKLRVGLFPFGGKLNPYTTLIGQCLDQAGVGWQAIQDTKIFPIRRAVGQPIDILQMYWPSNLYHSSTRLGTWAKRIMFADGLRCLRKFTFVYSVENLLPHDSANASLDKAFVQRIVDHADGLIVMAQASQRIFSETYRVPNRVVWGSIPHCNYIGWYPNSVSREEARARLGLKPSQRVLLSLGRIAGYKGLSSLVEAFAEANVPDSVLVVAGRPQSQSALAEVEQAVNALTRGKHCQVRLVPQFIPDDDLQVFYNAADAAALAYSDIPMNPGSVILAMSFGSCVWAAHKGASPELVGQRAFFGYADGDRAGMVRSLKDMLSRDDLRERGQEALERAKLNHGKEHVARQFADFYGRLIDRSRGAK